MHRAGVDRPLRRPFGFYSGHGVEISIRLGQELRLTSRGAEIVGPTVVIGPVRGRMRIDRHAADRITGAVRPTVSRLVRRRAKMFHISIQIVARQYCTSPLRKYRRGPVVRLMITKPRPEREGSL
ncbi:hypothetical protein D3C73_806550 [compost metagenome]